MGDDTLPPIPPRPPGWVSSPLSSPGSGPRPSLPRPQSASNEAPPPPLPPRRPTNEEQPPVLERQSRPYSYVPPSQESSGQSPPLPPRVTRRPVPQREPEPRPQVSPASPASSSSQPQFSPPQFEPFRPQQFRPQQFQAPKFEFNPPNPFQPQPGYQATPADFEAFKKQYAPPDFEALKAQYTPPDFEKLKAQYTPPNFEAFKTQYTPYQPQTQPQAHTTGQSSSQPQPQSSSQSQPRPRAQQQQQQQQTFPPPPSGPAPSSSASTSYPLPPPPPPTSPPSNPPPSNPPPSNPPPSNPPPSGPPPSSSPSAPIPYDKWTPLFQPNGSPNFIFIALMKSFFEMLVAQQTPEMKPATDCAGSSGGMAAAPAANPAVNGQKLLSPEKCSEFLDVQGFAVEHNSWKLNKTPWSTTPSVPGLPNPLAAVTPLDKADWEFRLILQAFGIHHIPIPRPRPPPSQRPPPVQTSPYIPSWLTNLIATEAKEIPEGMRVLGIGQTPFLTEQGFIKYMALETAGEPDRGFEGLNAALRYYGGQGAMGMGMGMKGWTKLGPIPREMFPATCPAEIQTAVDLGQAKHRHLCEDAVAGSRAYHEMAAQGRRNAEELVSDYRYVRVDQYGNRIW